MGICTKWFGGGLVIFENQYGLVDIQINDPKAVAVNLSAGPDSSLLLWMVAKSVENQDIVVKVVTSKTHVILEPCKKIINKVSELFPHINFKLSHTHIDETIPIGEFLQCLPKGTTQVFNGFQCNPPKEVQIEHGLWEERVPYKDREYVPFPVDFRGQYWPMRFTDKRFVAQAIKDYDLPWINYMTTTCDNCANFEDRPCKTCHSCRERYAFMGCYDWGITN